MAFPLNCPTPHSAQGSPMVGGGIYGIAMGACASDSCCSLFVDIPSGISLACVGTDGATDGESPQETIIPMVINLDVLHRIISEILMALFSITDGSRVLSLHLQTRVSFAVCA